MLKNARYSFGVRVDAGRRLRTIRQSWPKSGPRSSGWQRFLDEAAIDEYSLQRYLRAAREEDKARSKRVERAIETMRCLSADEREQVLVGLRVSST